MKARVLVVGSSNTDMVTISDRLPGPGETVIASHFYIAQGGKGANQAVAAARLGAEVTFVGRVGNDDFGRNAVRSYQSEGIEVSHFTFDKTLPTGTALINIDLQGENMIVASMGANNALDKAQIDGALHVLAQTDIVLTQLEMPLETVLYLAEQARSMGIPFILNPAPPRKISDELIGLTDYLIPNESEAEMLTGIRVNDEASALLASEDLLKRGAKNVIITMGPKGAFFLHPHGSGLIPAPKVKAVDTVGAGDTFNGAFAVAIAEGKPIGSAIEFANQCAALSVTREGAQKGIPYRKEIH